MLRLASRRVFRKLRFQMIDDNPQALLLLGCSLLPQELRKSDYLSLQIGRQLFEYVLNCPHLRIP